MKILYITNGINGSGGLERVLSIKASYLVDKLGYEVHIITLNQNDSPLFYEFSSKLKYHNIIAKGNPFRYFMAYVSGLKSKIKELSPDIISVCDDGLKGFYVPYIIGKNCPLIYERHASKNIFKAQDYLSILQKIKFGVLHWLMHIGGRRFDAFVVLTKDNLNEWNLNNLKVIPNPLSFYPIDKSNLKNKKVIAVGNHGFQKGYDRLIQSWKMVLEKHPDWQLEIYGKIDRQQKHLKLAKNLAINHNIHFYKPVKDIDKKYKEASIYAMSSRSEGFGMVLIEAMAFGLPCVSFNCPCGPKDIISSEVDGFLVENGNITEFTNKLNLLIENRALRQNMSEQARIKAKTYLPEIVVPMWHNLFLSLNNINN
ncbi:glycosyltransferase family 4 protein [Cognatitamlana onchidii]|uniref:glycosyltransferase family 4 protein n=1 Tax=Cognatitamlana onchidii TaxID=2562860 RepID=UPI0010A62AE9|nr:glycosyltransferase family 4 protein [Algibacter onchidii]